MLLLWFISLSCKIFMTGCEVAWVNRNVTDSFRVGKDGCTNNTSVCPSSSTCQADSGLCLCLDIEPSFRNPTRKPGNDTTYGCLSNRHIRLGAGEYL